MKAVKLFGYLLAITACAAAMAASGCSGAPSADDLSSQVKVQKGRYPQGGASGQPQKAPMGGVKGSTAGTAGDEGSKSANE